MLSLKTKLTCLTLLPIIISFGAFYLLVRQAELQSLSAGRAGGRGGTGRRAGFRIQ